MSSLEISPRILVIDPCIETLCTKGWDEVCRVHANFLKKNDYKISEIHRFVPFLHGQQSLASYLEKQGPYQGVILLGSAMHVTQKCQVLDTFTNDFKVHIFQKRIPFLGICFGHQFFADCHELTVSYLEDRDKMPEGKCKGFFPLYPTEEKIKLLLLNSTSDDFFSGNDFDREYRYLFRQIENWSGSDWEKLKISEFEQLTLGQKRLLNFLRRHSKDTHFAEARHEQEVLPVQRAQGSQPSLRVSARRDNCGVEALVHESAPFFSFQSHTEDEQYPDPEQGNLVFRNFLYLVHVHWELVSRAAPGKN